MFEALAKHLSAGGTTLFGPKCMGHHSNKSVLVCFRLVNLFVSGVFQKNNMAFKTFVLLIHRVTSTLHFSDVVGRFFFCNSYWPRFHLGWAWQGEKEKENRSRRRRRRTSSGKV